MVNGNTRFWAEQQDSLLDHCWMNTPARLIYIQNLSRAFSDHNLLLLSVRTKNKIMDRHDITKRDRSKMNLEEYRRDIGNIDWTRLMDSNDVNFVNNIFEEELLKALDKAAPVKSFKKRRKSNNWLTDEMKQQMTSRDELRETARDSNRLEDWKAYRNSRNNCIKSLRKCKEKHFRELFKKIETEKDTKKLYRLTNELLDIKAGLLPQQFLKDGVLLRKPEEMANHQMSYYEGKVQGLLRNIPVSTRNPLRFLEAALNSWTEKDARPIFKFKIITLTETESLLANMSDSLALGHDRIDSSGIKAAKDYLARPIMHIINTSLMEGKFANKWKISQLSPEEQGQ